MYSHIPVTLNRKSGIGDLLLLVLFLLFLHYFIGLAQEWTGAFQAETEIDLSLRALPGYAFFSLIRAFVAYFLSLGFTLVYGYVAAKSRLGERVLLPLLDIGQSIPVLGFMPGLVLGLIALFPKNNLGMELACILLIFTGQVWNMTFAFYASVRAIPVPFYEMSDVVGLSKIKRFMRVEFPASGINLAWNSLMSMAGGWFFLVTCESFTLGEKKFRLPGLGSYMSLAIERGDAHAMTAGVVAMCLVILFTDFLVWRPIIAWTRKFKLEESPEEYADVPFLTLLLRESRILKLIRWIFDHFARQAQPVMRPSSKAQPLPRLGPLPQPHERSFKKLALGPKARTIATRLLIATIFVLGFWVFGKLWELIRPLSGSDWLMILKDTGYTGLRVAFALVIASIWTVPFGIWVGRSPALTRFFQPIIQLAASFPAPMIYPIALALFAKLSIGLGLGSSFLMLLGVQWYILFNVLAGAIGISRELRDSLSLVGVDRKFRWKVLLLPSVFPALVTGWITAAGGAWNASVVAEYIQQGSSTIKTDGLGSLISEATASGNYPLLAGGLIAMVLTVVGVNRALWRPLQRYAENRFRFER